MQLGGMWRQLASLGAARLRVGLVDLALMAAIGLSLLAAAGFCISALHHVLRPLVGPAGASALMAAFLVIVALGLALWVSERRHRTPIATPVAAPPPPTPPDDTAAAPPPDMAAYAAFLAGFLLARRLF